MPVYAPIATYNNLRISATLLLFYGTKWFFIPPDEGSCNVFLTENIVMIFLYLMVLIFKIFIKNFSNCQFTVLRFLLIYYTLFQNIVFFISGKFPF